MDETSKTQRKIEMLRQISEHYGISKNSDFAKFFGLTIQTAFQRLKNGSIDYEQIYEKCPDISPDWLLSCGEGPMLRKDREPARKDEEMQGPVLASFEKMKELEEKMHVKDKELEEILEALRREQVMHTTTQVQMSGLIDILKNKG